MSPESEINIQEVFSTIRQRAEARRAKEHTQGAVLSNARPSANPTVAALGANALLQLESKIAVARSAQTEVGVLNPRRPGFHNKLIQALKRLIQRSLSWYTRPLVRFHSAILEALGEVVSALRIFQPWFLQLHKEQERMFHGFQNEFQGLKNQFIELRTQVLGVSDTHLGLKARNGLWFNEPIVLQYDSAGEPSWSSTTERIIERAWVLRHLSDIPTSAKILDLGCSESTLSLELASNGFNVVGIDIREYPLNHPNFKFMQLNICESKLAGDIFDVAIVLSTIEHVGLGAYGDAQGEGLDRLAMKELRRLLKPGGVLLLTTPFGKRAVTPLHRIADAASLRELLEGFEIQALEYGIKVDEKTWLSPVDEIQADRALDSEGRPRAVALVKAYKMQ